jgi:hypothetical protein
MEAKITNLLKTMVSNNNLLQGLHESIPATKTSDEASIGAIKAILATATKEDRVENISDTAVSSLLNLADKMVQFQKKAKVKTVQSLLQK